VCAIKRAEEGVNESSLKNCEIESQVIFIRVKQHKKTEFENKTEAMEATQLTPSDASTESDGGNDALNLLAEVGSYVLLFLLIFGLSATVDIEHLKQQLHNKGAILTGVCMQFLIMPVLGFVAVIALRDIGGEGEGLTRAMGVTLLIVTASPGGSYSNWWCSLFNADLALSVAMTALSTLLSAIFLPANLLLYAHFAYGKEEVMKAIDFGGLFTSIGVVVVAIATGLYVSYLLKSDTARNICNRLGSVSGVLLIVFNAVVSSLSGGEQTNLWDQQWPFYVAVSMPCVAGLIVANALGRLARLERPEVVTVAVECCYQNVGIATSAAISMFKSDPTARAQALCVPLYYGIVEAVVLGLYCIVAWKCGWTKAPRNEKFCVIIVTSYEVDTDIIEDVSLHLPDLNTNTTEDEDSRDVAPPLQMECAPPMYSRTRLHSDDALSLAHLGMAPPDKPPSSNDTFASSQLETLQEEQSPRSFLSRIRNVFSSPSKNRKRRQDDFQTNLIPSYSTSMVTHASNSIIKKNHIREAASVVVDLEVPTRDRMWSEDNTATTTASSTVTTSISNTHSTISVPSHKFRSHHNQDDDRDDDDTDDIDDAADDNFHVQIQVDYDNTTLANDTSQALPPPPPGPPLTTTSATSSFTSTPLQTPIHTPSNSFTSTPLQHATQPHAPSSLYASPILNSPPLPHLLPSSHQQRQGAPLSSSCTMLSSTSLISGSTDAMMRMVPTPPTLTPATATPVGNIVGTSLISGNIDITPQKILNETSSTTPTPNPPPLPFTSGGKPMPYSRASRSKSYPN